MVSLAIAFILMVVAIVAMSTNGFNYALDFTAAPLARCASTGRSRPDAAPAPDRRRFENPLVQTFGTEGEMGVA